MEVCWDPILGRLWPSTTIFSLQILTCSWSLGTQRLGPLYLLRCFQHMSNRDLFIQVFMFPVLKNILYDENFPALPGCPATIRPK